MILSIVQPKVSLSLCAADLVTVDIVGSNGTFEFAVYESGPGSSWTRYGHGMSLTFSRIDYTVRNITDGNTILRNVIRPFVMLPSNFLKFLYT